MTITRTFWRVLSAAAFVTAAAGISAFATAETGRLRHSTAASIPSTYLLLFFTLWTVLGVGAVLDVWHWTREQPHERLVQSTRMYGLPNRTDPDKQETL